MGTKKILREVPKLTPQSLARLGEDNMIWKNFQAGQAIHAFKNTKSIDFVADIRSKIIWLYGVSSFRSQEDIQNNDLLYNVYNILEGLEKILNKFEGYNINAQDMEEYISWLLPLDINILNDSTEFSENWGFNHTFKRIKELGTIIKRIPKGTEEENVLHDIKHELILGIIGSCYYPRLFLKPYGFTEDQHFYYIFSETYQTNAHQFRNALEVIKKEKVGEFEEKLLKFKEELKLSFKYLGFLCDEFSFTNENIYFSVGKYQQEIFKIGDISNSINLFKKEQLNLWRKKPDKIEFNPTLNLTTKKANKYEAHDNDKKQFALAQHVLFEFNPKLEALLDDFVLERFKKASSYYLVEVCNLDILLYVENSLVPILQSHHTKKMSIIRTIEEKYDLLQPLNNYMNMNLLKLVDFYEKDGFDYKVCELGKMLITQIPRDSMIDAKSVKQNILLGFFTSLYHPRKYFTSYGFAEDDKFYYLVTDNYQSIPYISSINWKFKNKVVQQKNRLNYVFQASFHELIGLRQSVKLNPKNIFFRDYNSRTGEPPYFSIGNLEYNFWMNQSNDAFGNNSDTDENVSDQNLNSEYNQNIHDSDVQVLDAESIQVEENKNTLLNQGIHDNDDSNVYALGNESIQSEWINFNDSIQLNESKSEVDEEKLNQGIYKYDDSNVQVSETESIKGDKSDKSPSKESVNYINLESIKLNVSNNTIEKKYESEKEIVEISTQESSDTEKKEINLIQENKANTTKKNAEYDEAIENARILKENTNLVSNTDCTEQENKLDAQSGNVYAESKRKDENFQSQKNNYSRKGRFLANQPKDHTTYNKKHTEIKTVGQNVPKKKIRNSKIKEVLQKNPYINLDDLKNNNSDKKKSSVIKQNEISSNNDINKQVKEITARIKSLFTKFVQFLKFPEDYSQEDMLIIFSAMTMLNILLSIIVKVYCALDILDGAKVFLFFSFCNYLINRFILKIF